MHTLVFIPAWNEEESVAAVISSVHARLPSVDIMVIDDGSTDRTAEVAAMAGARVASLPFNQGLGAALQTGYIYALREGYDFCAHLDADGQHPAEELAALLDEVWSNRCDLALGSRYHTPTTAELDGAYQASFVRSIGIALFRNLLTFTTHHHFTDTTSGFRAANRRVMRLFANYYSPDFAELESLQRAVRQGVRITELQVRMLPRMAGKSKITPLKSTFFVFKGLLVLVVGAFRNIEIEHIDFDERAERQTKAPTQQGTL